MTRGYGEVRVISVQYFEWTIASGWGYMGVKDKLCSGQVPHPVVLVFIAEEFQVLLNFLVCMFHLPVTLWVVCGHEACIDSEFLVEFSHQFCGELGSSVWNEFLRNSMKLEIFSVVQVGYSCHVNISSGRNKVGLFWVEIDVCDYSIVSFTFRESRNFIYSDYHPGC